jgi:hypothetical protein
MPADSHPISGKLHCRSVRRRGRDMVWGKMDGYSSKPHYSDRPSGTSMSFRRRAWLSVWPTDHAHRWEL